MPGTLIRLNWLVLVGHLRFVEVCSLSSETFRGLLAPRGCLFCSSGMVRVLSKVQSELGAKFEVFRRRRRASPAPMAVEASGVQLCSTSLCCNLFSQKEETCSNHLNLDCTEQSSRRCAEPLAQHTSNSMGRGQALTRVRPFMSLSH